MSPPPGHENWTWGAVEGVFAESPDRVFIVQRGELPVVARPAQTPVPQFGPSLSFPTAQVPFRNASQGPVAALPGGGAPGQLAEDAEKNSMGRLGVDARWEDNIVVIDAQGNITERWTQWDSMIKRAPAVYIMRSCARADSPMRRTDISSVRSPESSSCALIADQPHRHAGVVVPARLLDGARPLHSRAHLGRRFVAGSAAKFLVRHSRHLDVDVDAVQQRAADFPR